MVEHAHRGSRTSRAGGKPVGSMELLEARHHIAEASRLNPESDEDAIEDLGCAHELLRENLT